MEPEDNCILVTLAQIERISPENTFPDKIRSDITEKLVTRATEFADKKQWTAARETIRQGIMLDPENLSLTAFLARIDAMHKGKCPKEMVAIGGGRLQLGSAADDPQRRAAELKSKSVYVGSFCIDTYEFPGIKGRKARQKTDWKSADKRCRALGKRLCYESEWERACKGDENLAYPYGANYSPQACITENRGTAPGRPAAAGSADKCASPFGVYDLSGNVAEWTADRARPGSSLRIVKGGSALSPQWSQRCAAREMELPESSAPFLGFRCCADPR